MSTDLATRPHVVYRCYDAEERLLYVGCTHDIAMRLRYHRRDTAWFGEVESVTSESHPNRVAALEAERQAIVTEKPSRNVAYAHWSPWQVEAVATEKSAALPGQTALSAARSR